MFEVAEPFEIIDSKLHGGTYIESEWVEMACMLNYEKRDTKTLEALKNIIPSVLEGMTPKEIREHIK